MSKLRATLLAIALLLSLLAAKAWHDTMADPVVRRATVALPGYPAGTPPLTIALLSDIHVAGPDMPPARLARIVGQVNALRPDLVLIAGDFVSDKGLATRHYSTAEAVAPLAGLRPAIATVAVLGNHDHWRGAGEVRRELARIGAVVLANDARRFGPLVIGGLDDDYTANADVARTLNRMDALGPAQVLLGHSPDPFPKLPHPVGLVLAGHTHCGQVRFPLIGAPVTNSHYGARYACGLVRERGAVLIVTAGLGTSVLPFRFGARPDVWLVTVRARE